MQQTIDWKTWDKYIGKFSDDYVAQVIDCPIRLITQRREKLQGLNRIYWEKWDHLFKEKTITEIAAIIGCEVKIAEKRYETIKRYRKSKKNINWEINKHILGTDSDTNVAKKLGCSPKTIKNKRGEFKIPSYSSLIRKKKYVEWKKYDYLFETHNDQEISIVINTEIKSVERRRRFLNNTKENKLIDWKKWDHLLGVESDVAISKKIGCSRKTVLKRRKKLYIKAYNV